MIAAAAGDRVVAEQALGCAVADSDASGEVWAEAEIERARAALLRLQGADAAAVEGALQAAIAIAERSGTPACTKPMNSGTAEHEQNGVTMPSVAAITLPAPSRRPDSRARVRSGET